MDSIPVTGLIMAGGQSRRMGRDKAWIDFQGKALVEHVLDHVRPLCSEVYIVANDAAAFESLGVPVVPDIFPGKGPLGGVYSGMLVAREQHCLAVACDMPFLNPALVRFLISLAPDYDVVIPRAKDPSGRTPHPPSKDRMAAAPDARFRRLPIAKQSDLHPMHAIYSKSCIPSIQSHLKEGDLRLIAFFQELRVRIVEQAEVDRYDPTHLSFFNVNSPDDLVKAQALAGNASSNV
ncbi:MAG: molybdenum cofactor guanylyltransferase [Chloroflexi bacterium]|nr:molybdenum cofactor guanylyltransferase [Chloroflexota bacterium]